jgi:protein-L-isoaspartate(D-aspartate) O-methyltransferase
MVMVPVMSTQGAVANGEQDRAIERAHMVKQQLRRRGIKSQAVLEALGSIPRELFMGEAEQPHAYADCALPIAGGQTISQPYIVALMSELAEVGPGSRVLEIGTGSGYQAAVLAALGAQVFTIEIQPALLESALRSLDRLGISVRARPGDGRKGWPEQAPFDAILVTAAPREVPPALREQLKPGGRLVVPVGAEEQNLLVIRRTETGFSEERVAAVRFVPLVSAGPGGTPGTSSS